MENIESIKGLSLISSFISEDEEKVLIEYINKQKWSSAPGKREVQQYGYEYNYGSKYTKPSATMSIPKEFKALLEKVNKFFKTTPDQIIVNKYEPGQGIAPHVDHIKHFGPVVASLTLQSGTIMEMSRKIQDNNEIKTIKIPMYLEKCSLLILTNEARYDFMHCIPARKTDIVDDKTINRGTRISITFRTMNS